MRFALAAAAMLLAGSGAPRFTPSEAPAPLRHGLSRAEAAIQAAACDAERRFGEGDPDANASRCEGARAPAGVEVGRTSARLRNPRNAPPAWAKAYLAQTGLSCHAGRAEVAESTRAWLEEAYPGDQSFGYALGDLRGFWWAEAAK